MRAATAAIVGVAAGALAAAAAIVAYLVRKGRP